jgi:hypothetical protein
MLDLRHLCDLRVELGEPIELGDDALRGRRRIIPIIGGTVSGERLCGQVLNGGADWQTVFTDGTAELESRYMIRTHDDVVIDVRNYGYRHGPATVLAALARGESVDPGSYYMRTQPRFETGDRRYQWLNRMIAVGTGAREAAAVVLTFYEVL